MGQFFNNIHFLKNTDFDKTHLIDSIIKYMNGKSFTFDMSSADLSVIIYDPSDSDWISIATDAFEFSSLEVIKNTFNFFSTIGSTCMIAASCYDSDFLQLALNNFETDEEGWLNAGHPEDGMKLKRTSLSPWRPIVKDFNKLKEISSTDYVFAEEAFGEVADLIGMNQKQTTINTNIESYDESELIKLFFSAPKEKEDFPQFEIPRANGLPCRIGESNVVSVVNKGGQGKGLGVMFVGDYVENDEITFSDTELQLHDNGKWKFIPFELQKGKQRNGKMCYFWTDPDFPIPSSISGNIPFKKRMEMEFEREIGIRFTPQGNPRKVLDIKIVIYPLSNSRNGQASWYVYKSFGSKANYIEFHNEYIKKYHTTWNEDELFNPNDYDLE